MTGEVPTMPRALPQFRFELRLDKLFDVFWVSIGVFVVWIYVKFSVQARLVDGQSSNLRPFIHCHDLSAFSCCGVRHGRLPNGRIQCYLQALCIALSCLLLVNLDCCDLPCQCREFHCQMRCGDYGSKLVVCLPAA